MNMDIALSFSLYASPSSISEIYSAVVSLYSFNVTFNVASASASPSRRWRTLRPQTVASASAI